MTEHQAYMAAPWFGLLETAVATHPRRIAGVADHMGVSRPALSQILNGKYPAQTDRIARKVLDHYDRPDCPLVGRVIDRTLCRKTSLRPQPSGGDALARWKVCQACPHKPSDKETP